MGKDFTKIKKRTSSCFCVNPKCGSAGYCLGKPAREKELTDFIYRPDPPVINETMKALNLPPPSKVKILFVEIVLYIPKEARKRMYVNELLDLPTPYIGKVPVHLLSEKHRGIVFDLPCVSETSIRKYLPYAVQRSGHMEYPVEEIPTSPREWEALLDDYIRSK
jgi:hypothetical protein